MLTFILGVIVGGVLIYFYKPVVESWIGKIFKNKK
jgi:hypothetical protein